MICITFEIEIFTVSIFNIIYVMYLRRVLSLKRLESEFILNRHKNIEGYLFIAPWIIGFLCFVLFPIVFSLFLSFTEWPLIGQPTWVGLKNYSKLFSDLNFYHSLFVTLIYTLITVVPGMIVSILISVLLNQKVRFMSFFRIIFYLPTVIPGIAVYVMFMWILNPDYGLMNYLLSLIRIQGPKWLQSSDWSLISLAIVSLWSIGFNIVLYLAGLQGIPSTYYEAAKIDGASSIRMFFKITLPLLTPTIFFSLIIGIINSFQAFNQVLVMTGGGPADSTLLYGLYIFKNAFQYFKMGYASALSWTLLIILLIFTLVIFKTANKWVYYEGEK